MGQLALIDFIVPCNLVKVLNAVIPDVANLVASHVYLNNNAAVIDYLIYFVWLVKTTEKDVGLLCVD